MSYIDERWEVYDKVCKGRFTDLENKVDDLHTTVKNGLSSKVSALWKLSWFLIFGVISTLVTVIIDLAMK